MKPQAGKPRAKQAGRKATQRAPLTRLVIVDALRTWVVPTAAVVVGFAVFVVYNIGLVEEPFAVTTVGLLALAVALFYGVRAFVDAPVTGSKLAVLIGFVILWSVSTAYPFHRAINPGVPLFTAELNRDGTPVKVPFSGRGGRFSMVVEGHFLPAEGRSNRTAAYTVSVGHDGVTDHLVQGSFNQTWGSQRIGSGRRSTTVPVMRQTTQALDMIDDPDGRDLTLKLTELSPGVRDTLTVRIYAETVPKALLVALGVLTVAGALIVDAWRAKGASDGLMTTLTLAAFISIVTFRASTAATPGFPQLVIAALMGTLAGAIAGSILSRLTQPLKRYIVARS